jgi:hypothetical protein
VYATSSNWTRSSADVIIKRYIEQVGGADGVTVQRDGLTYRYDEVADDPEEVIPLF